MLVIRKATVSDSFVCRLHLKKSVKFFIVLSGFFFNKRIFICTIYQLVKVCEIKIVYIKQETFLKIKLMNVIRLQKKIFYVRPT